MNPLQLHAQELLGSGDFLVVRTNGSRDLIGRAACILDGGAAIGSYFASYLIQFRMTDPAIGPWLSLWWWSPYMRVWLGEHAASSAGEYNVSMSTLATAPIPMPGFDEIARVTAIVEQCLEIATAKLFGFESALRAVVRLEQAALAKAFRGELVTQDPTDESASILLERIRAARAADPDRPRQKRDDRRDASAPPQVSTATSSNRSATNGAHDPSLDLIAATFQSDGRLSAAAIAEATGLDVTVVNESIKALVDAGQVRVHGRARSTTYEWNA